MGFREHAHLFSGNKGTLTNILRERAIKRLGNREYRILKIISRKQGRLFYGNKDPPPSPWDGLCI